MKKTWKKIISVLLVIAMVTGGIFLPERNVYADTGGDTTGGVGGGTVSYTHLTLPTNSLV